MNIVVANKYRDLLSNIEKSEIFNGTYNADSLIEMLRNFRYDKVVIDLTAVNNYKDIGNLRLIASLNPNNVVLFLDDNDTCSSKEFLASLVSVGFYNFTRNLEGVKHLLASPNTFDKVSSLVKNEKKEIVQEEKKEEIKSEETKEDYNPFFDTSIAEKKLNTFVEPNSINYLNVKQPDVSTPKSFGADVIANQSESSYDEQPTNEVKTDFLKYSTYNNNKNTNNKIDDETDNNPLNSFINSETTNEENTFTEYEDITNDESENYNFNYKEGRKVIGIKNLTPHAGATSLIYMMYKELQNSSYNTIAIEVDEFDFMVYKIRNFLSVTKNELAQTIQKYSTVDIILVDLNNFEDMTICDEVLYLVEPSYVMLNKLMLKDKDTFKDLKGEKIILNKSLLNNNDINEFEYEAKTKIFYNMPPLDDRAKKNQDIINLLKKLQIKM